MKTRRTFQCISLTILFTGIFSINGNCQDTTAASVPVVQDEKPNKASGGSMKFHLAGEGVAQWQLSKTSGNLSSNTFNPLGLMLMPLVKLNDKLFMDVQIGITPNLGAGGGVTTTLNELILYYKVAPDVSVFFGNFSPKYGIYMGVLDDFTNRYGSAPIGMGRGPQTETGVGIQGGIQAGYSKLNYQLYVANGPQYIVDSTTQGSGNLTGQLSYGNYTDNNRSKAVGGSIGLLPFSNSNLQVDVSGQYKPKTGNASSVYKNISSSSWAADLNYYHVFNPITVRVLAEYNSTQVQNLSSPIYTDASKTTLLVPQFNNMLSGWFCGATLRASGINNLFVSNLELGGRIGAYAPPKDALWGGTQMNQTTVCLTYWFSWQVPFSFFYDVYTQAGSPTQSSYTVMMRHFF